MKTKNGLNLFPGFLTPAANRKLSENFKLIDPILDASDNYILVNGVKQKRFVALQCDISQPLQKGVINLTDTVSTINAKNGIIIVSAILMAENNAYSWPILLLSNEKMENLVSLNLQPPIEFNYLTDQQLRAAYVGVYVL